MQNQEKIVNAVNVLIQVAHLAQAKGILSIKEAAVVNGALELFDEIQAETKAKEPVVPNAPPAPLKVVRKQPKKSIT